MNNSPLTIITLRKLKEDIFLKSPDNPKRPGGFSWHRPEKEIKAGEYINVLIEKHKDGRVYRTAFRKYGNRIWNYTIMYKKEGRGLEINRNCGPDPSVMEKIIRKELKKRLDQVGGAK